MKIYDAIMKAADHIERHPREFEFMSCTIPSGPGCGSPGCALGWIGFFAGFPAFSDAGRVSEELLGLPKDRGGKFYRRMHDIHASIGGADSWRETAAILARNLRLYAEKYHGHEKQVTPDWHVIAASPLIPEHVKSEELVS